MASVSVIIPNYNRAALIRTTITNVLNQTYSPQEIIVVDDGSTDASVEVLRTFGNRIYLIEQSNQGPGAARNRGLEAASGEFIQFMDSDDLTSLNKLEVQLASLQQTGADLAYGPWVRTLIHGKQLRFSGPIMQSESLPAWKSMLEWQLGGKWCTIFQSCLFRRKALDAAGRYCTDMCIAEDGEYLVRILLAGARPVYTGDCLTFYRTHDTEQISGSASSRRRQTEDLTTYFERVGQHLGDELTNLHPSTQREAVLRLYRHHLYCAQYDHPMVQEGNSIAQLLQTYPALWLRILDWNDRLCRKLTSVSATTPTCPGLMVSSPSQQTYDAAQGLGFMPS